MREDAQARPPHTQYFAILRNILCSGVTLKGVLVPLEEQEKRRKKRKRGELW